MKMKKRIISTIFSLGIIFLIVFLSMEFVSAESGSTHTNFSMVTSRPSCRLNYGETIASWVFWKNPPGELEWEQIGVPMPPRYSCHRIGGYPSDGCCPNVVEDFPLNL